MGYSFHFSSLCPAPFIELYMCQPIQISYLNFKAVLALPKTPRSTQTRKSISWIVWTLYMYISGQGDQFAINFGSLVLAKESGK